MALARPEGYGYIARLANGGEEHSDEDSAVHYPHRLSRRKRYRKQGFRARMRTPGGRKMIARKRAKGRRLNVKSRL